MGQLINIEEIKALYPNEWVLLGNPIMDDSRIDVLSGIPLFHSKDKKEVCYIGRDKTSNFDKITLIYTGTFRPTRKITGIFSDYDGLLGLDFFESTKFCIDTRENTIDCH
jgi:hypothetical protein